MKGDVRHRWLRLLTLPVMLIAVTLWGGENPIKVPGSASTRIGLYVADLATGDVIYDVNSQSPFVPASIMKALTSASALTTRSASDRFATEVVLTGDVKKRRAAGNLVVRCVGDPTIESSHFDNVSGFADSIVAAVRSLGIDEIGGTVVIDEELVPDDGVPSGWVDEDIVWPYGTAHHGANFYDNKFILSVPGNRMKPYVPDLVVSHTPGKGALTVDRDRNSEVVRTKGTPRRQGESMTISIPYPAKAMRHEIISRLRDAGVKVGDAKADASDYETLVYTQFSPELIEVLRSLMFRSDNMMAEAMLRNLSPGSTRAQAARSEIDMWELRDIDTDNIVVEDGSGLSRNDRLTPRFLAEVFTWMASHFKAAEYASLFPRAGMEGTMKNFLRDTPLQGRVAFKTGSMKGVQSYAGYLLGNDGLPTHVVVVMVNGFTCGRATLKTAIEDMLLHTFAPGYERAVKKAAPKKAVAKKSSKKKPAAKAPAKKSKSKSKKSTRK